METLIASAKGFVQEINQKIAEKNLNDSCILNTDQLGFQIELRYQHTLEQKGTKIVESSAQALKSLSHSYTIQPLIALEGNLFTYVNLYR